MMTIKKNVLSKEQLDKIRQCLVESKDTMFPMVKLGEANDNIEKLLDYIEYLEKDADRLRRSIV